MESSEAQARIAALSDEIDSLSRSIADETDRKALLGVITQSLNKVESPVETIWRTIMSVRNPI